VNKGAAMQYFLLLFPDGTFSILKSSLDRRPVKQDFQNGTRLFLVDSDTNIENLWEWTCERFDGNKKSYLELSW
jgi:hypothetical protein